MLFRRKILPSVKKAENISADIEILAFFFNHHMPYLIEIYLDLKL